MRASKGIWLLRGLYLLYFGAYAYYIPYINVYLEGLGLSGSEIGLVRSLPSLVGIVAAPIWGFISDALNVRRRLVIIGLASSTLVLLLFSRATHLVWLIFLASLYALMIAPVVPMLTSMTLEQLGEKRVEYGQTRLWGAVGWGIMAPLAGWLIHNLGVSWIFYGYTILAAIGLMLATRLPAAGAGLEGAPIESVRLLLSDRKLQVFLVSVFLAGVGSAVSTNFLVLFLKQLGGSEALYGLSLTVTTLSEIPVYFFAATLLRRFRIRSVILGALAGYVTYLFLCAQLVNPIWVLPVQLLLGGTFGALWTSGVEYMERLAPPALRATAQSLFGSVFMGLGHAAGAVVGGALYDGVGPVATFRLTGLVVLVGLGLFWAMGSD